MGKHILAFISLLITTLLGTGCSSNIRFSPNEIKLENTKNIDTECSKDSSKCQKNEPEQTQPEPAREPVAELPDESQPVIPQPVKPEPEPAREPVAELPDESQPIIPQPVKPEPEPAPDTVAEQPGASTDDSGDCTATQNCRIIDTFTENELRGRDQLDILVVVDNSYSMMKEHKEMGKRIEAFLNPLNNNRIDWQLGITTTDVTWRGARGELLPFTHSNGQSNGQKILTSSTRNYESLFSSTIQRPRSEIRFATVNEKPLKATIMAIEKKDNENRHFFRDGADLAVIIISDEDETYPEGDIIRELQEKVQRTWNHRKSLTVYGIIIKPNDKKCLDKNNGLGVYGNIIFEAIQRTGGRTGNICANNYSSLLSEIGTRVNTILKKSFTLSYQPQINTVRVKTIPTQTISWKIMGNKITFESLSPSTRIEVNYLPIKK